MPDWELYKELDKRGALPPGKKQLYEEAKGRGLVPGLESTKGATGISAPEITGEVAGAFGGQKPPQWEVEMPFPSILPKSQGLETLHFVGKGLIGGGLRTIRGAVPLPFDIAAYFGNEKAEKIAENIRRNVPQVKADTTVENISQVISQYAIPSGLGIKAANLVLKGSSLAARFIGGLFTSGLTDFIAANPEEGTAADVVPVVGAMLPTSSRKDEPALSRKAKIGTEGALIPLPIIGATKVVGTAVKIGERVLNPGKFIRGAVAKTLQDQAIDVPRALAEIDNTLKKQLTEGFEPTLGTSSGDPGLIGLEKYMAQQPELFARKELNMKAISDALEEVTGSMGGDPARAKMYFEDYLENQLKQVKDPLEATENAWKAVEAETDNLVHDFTYGKGKQAEASLILDDTIRQTLDSLTATKNKLFKGIDPTNSVVIPKDRLRAAYASMVKKTSPLDSTPGKISGSFLNRIGKILKPTQKGEKEISLTFGALQDLRPDLAEEIKNARGANQGGAVERLSEFKKAVEAETDYLAAQGGEAAEQAKKALSFYRNEYAPKFREGIGSLFREAERKGKPWPGTSVGGKFLFRPTGATEAAGQLKNLAAGPEAEGAIRDYLTGTIADNIYSAKSGQAALDRLDKFLNQRPVRETLDQYPGVKTEVEEFKRSLSAGLEKKTLLGQQIESQKQYLAKTEKELRKNAATFFVDKDPIHAVGSVLRSPEPVKNMQELVTLAARDKTGDAIAGLRQSLSEYLEQNLRGTTEIGGELEVLRSKVVKLLGNKETRRTISMLYSPADMSVIEKIANDMHMLNRINKQVTAGSPTAPIQEAISSARIVLASLYGIVKGQGVFKISGWLATRFNRDPVELAKELLKDAMLNPDLGRTLLMMDNKASEKIIKQRLGTYIINNLMTSRKEENVQ